MRFAAEAGDDGAAQSRSKTAFLFILSQGCGSRRSFGPSDCGGSRPLMGACRACAYYPKLGRPSIDPVLVIRMLVVGYVFAIRSERALCRDVQVNLAYRWFCGAISRQAIDSGLIPGTAPRAVLLKYGTDSRIIIHRALPLPFHLPGVLPFTGCGTMPGSQPPRSSSFHAGKAALSTRPDQAVAL
jgi:hypothetical protein